MVLDKIKCNIIVCGPAVGKTYLAIHDKRFVDVDAMKNDYKYNLYNMSLLDKEKNKLNRGEVVNSDSLEYSIKLLERTLEEKKIVLISFDNKLIDYILDKGYEYCLVYANYNLREEYAKRMEERGNELNFIEEMTGKKEWEQFYKENVNDPKPKYKIELKSGEFLSDIKEVFM